MTTAKRQAILVTGMHRSGTSAVARMVNLLGVAIADNLVPSSFGNEEGHWESANVVALHEEMLTSAGRRWDSVLGIEPAWFQSAIANDFVHRLADLIDLEFPSARIFVVKDPRLSLFVPIWRQALDRRAIAPLFVVPFRHPQEVASSLTRRQGFFEAHGVWPPARGMLLWLWYVLTLEKDTRGLPRSFVHFDALLDGWAAEAERIAGQLGIEWPAADAAARSTIDAFLNKGHKHANLPAHPVEAKGTHWSALAFEQLMSCVGHPEGGAEIFDAAKVALDGASEIFGRVGPLELSVHMKNIATQSQNRARHIEGLEQQLAMLRQRPARIETEMREIDRAVNHCKRTTGESRTEVKTKRWQIQELERANGERLEAIARLAAELEPLRENSAATQAQIDAITASRSWRLMSPLRRLSAAINPRRHQ